MTSRYQAGSVWWSSDVSVGHGWQPRLDLRLDQSLALAGLSEGSTVSDEARVDERHPRVQLLLTLLIHVSCAIDRAAGPIDVLLDVSLHALAVRLNASYMAAGVPYGDDEAGFRRWLRERWPAPPAA